MDSNEVALQLALKFLESPGMTFTMGDTADPQKVGEKIGKLYLAIRDEIALTTNKGMAEKPRHPDRWNW